MDCACSAFVFLGGLTLIIVSLVMKGIPLGATRILPTWAACVVGGALMIPMCCGQGAILTYGGYLGAEYAAKNPNRQMKMFDPQMTAEIQQQVLVPALIVNAATFLIALGIALAVGFLAHKPRTPHAQAPNYGYAPPPDQGFRPDGPGPWAGGS